tara:strand:- start:1045 stop:1830 length:786 start_codon:yes stop_codon:yes gene_type:complete
MRYAFHIKDKKIKSFFNENGYVVIKNFYSKIKCDEFLKIITKYASKEYPPIMNPDREDFLISQSFKHIENLNNLRNQTLFVRNLQKDANFFRTIITNKKILDLLSKIKKRKVGALMSQMIFKKAKTKYSLQSWEPHQDNSYPRNKNGEYITINIFMSNSNKKNGTLYIWEKSHLYGIFNYKKKISYREKDNKPGNISQSNKKFNSKILNFKKGDLLILHGNLVHGSLPNKSKKSRPLYSASYIPLGEKFVSGKNAQRKILS